MNYIIKQINKDNSRLNWIVIKKVLLFLSPTPITIQIQFESYSPQQDNRMSGFRFPGFSSGYGDSDDDNGQDVDNKQYYQILQLKQDASQDDIKKAYMRLAKIHHPDKNGGDGEKFKKIGEAYETLKDVDKRKMYDKYGKKGQQMGGGEDLLNMFFGGGGRRQGGKKEIPKVQPTKKGLQITLQNVYNGDLLKIPHKRTRFCEKCHGKGGQNVEKCKTCKGQGRVVQMFQMGPGMYQQVQKNCDKCQGQGQIIGEGGKCQTCKGKKILQKEKTIQVAIDKGTPNNYPIKIAGQGNQIPDAMAGDLIFITQQKQHATFTRMGADLSMKKSITLREALTGFDFKIKHLDGTEYTIYTGKGEVISDEMKKVVRGLGMPFHKDPMSHGNLIIQFHVAMPKKDELTKQQLDALIALLPGKVNKRPVGDNYEMFEDLDVENLNTNEEGGKKPEDQYDQDAEHQGVSCGTH